MVRRRAQNRKKQNNRQRRRRQPRQRRIPVRNGPTSNSQSLGSMVAKGVRSVLGALPGSKLTTKVADFIFSAVGWSDESVTPVVGTQLSVNAAQITGLCGVFEIENDMFSASVPSIGVIKPKLSGNPELANISSQWTTIRISVLKIVARPSGPLGTVSGTWAIGYLPYTDAQARADILKNVKAYGVNFEMIRQLSCSCMGDANKPLTIRYYHTPRDGYAYQPHSVLSDAPIGAVFIAYQDIMRTAYTEFTSGDFQTTIDVSSNLIYSGRNPMNAVVYDNLLTTVTDTPLYLKTPNAHIAFLPSNFKCANNKKGACEVTGVPASVQPDITSLALMALD